MWVCFLGYLVVHYVLSFYYLNLNICTNWTQNLLYILLLNCSTKWAETFRIYYSTLLLTIDYATVEKQHAQIQHCITACFASFNTFSFVNPLSIYVSLSLLKAHCGVHVRTLVLIYLKLCSPALQNWLISDFFWIIWKTQEGFCNISHANQQLPFKDKNRIHLPYLNEGVA